MTHTVCEKCTLWIFGKPENHKCKKIHDCSVDGHKINWAISMGTCEKCKQVFNNEINDNLELDEISNYY
jgi:Zn finger protein HypA/HybF involved in hydrogenase expression